MSGWRTDSYCNISIFVKAELKNWTDEPLIWSDELPGEYRVTSVMG